MTCSLSSAPARLSSADEVAQELVPFTDLRSDGFLKRGIVEKELNVGFELVSGAETQQSDQHHGDERRLHPSSVPGEDEREDGQCWIGRPDVTAALLPRASGEDPARAGSRRRSLSA
jgi:hypothetical protein